jgi:hypothetical protein
MDKRFLDKVVDQIVSETMVDYEKERAYTPFSFSTLSYFTLSLVFSSPRSPFTKHCKNVYGLNKEETEYVWEEYRRIIKDKIENNG